MKSKTADKEAEKALALLAGSPFALPHDELLRLAPLIVAFIDRKTAHALACVDVGDKPEDRLFEALMARFEAMQPHRAGILALAFLARRTPPLAAAIAKAQISAMRDILSFACPGQKNEEMPGRALVLLGLYHFVFCLFEREENEGLPLTMRRLNATLQTCKNIFFHTQK